MTALPLPTLTSPPPAAPTIVPLAVNWWLPPLCTTTPNLEWLLAMEAYAVWECAKSVEGIDGVAQMWVWFAVMEKYPIFRQNVVGKYTREAVPARQGSKVLSRGQAVGYGISNRVSEIRNGRE